MPCRSSTSDVGMLKTGPTFQTMVEYVSGCMICGRPLRYLEGQRPMTCSICHKEFMSNAECEAGHFVCDGCHRGDLSIIEASCLASTSLDPSVILTDLMLLPGVHMHGPEHHVLVGSSILAAYRNSGNDIDLPAALREMSRRGGQVPGGACGLWGACGAAISCGIGFSIITGSSPMSGESWGQCNTLTSECLAAIGSFAGPRCCKRDGYLAIIAAAKYIDDALDAGMTVPSSVGCLFSSENPQCIGERCPFRISRGRARPRSSPSRWAWSGRPRWHPWSWR